MITKLTIDNYRCIRHAEIELGPLTALVGPNGSGKSSVLKALQPVWRGVRDEWRFDSAHHTSLHIERNRGEGANYSPHGQSRGQWCTSEPHQFSLEDLRRPNALVPTERLDYKGTNFANVFGSLTRKEQTKLSEEFCRLVPTFSDVDLEASGQPGFHQIRFQDRWSHDVWYRPDEVSDGSILMVAYLTLQFRDAPEIVTLEEPERGLHPYLMQQLVAFLRGMATGTIGPKPVQIILATHSGDLLDHLLPEEVRFLDRDPKDGAVAVHQVDATKPKWEEAFRQAKDLLMQWIQSSPQTERDVRTTLAKTIDLAEVSRRCGAFALLLRELRQPS